MNENLISEGRPHVARPWPLMLAAGIELLLGLGSAAIAGYLFRRSSAASVVVAVVAAIAFASATGLFRRSKLGWWITVTSNLLFAAVLFWDALSENYTDVAEIIAGALFLALTFLVLLAPIRRAIYVSCKSSIQENCVNTSR